MSDEVKLLPCPFCGGEAKVAGYDICSFEVACTDCKAGVGWVVDYQFKADAIAAWNRRAAAEPVSAADFAALRAVEVAWLTNHLNHSIANLGYPVGCGQAPEPEQVRRAAETLFERYAKMIEMARSAGALEPAPAGEPVAWPSREHLATHLADLDGVRLQEIKSTVGPVEDANNWRKYLGRADDLLAKVSADRPAPPDLAAENKRLREALEQITGKFTVWKGIAGVKMDVMASDIHDIARVALRQPEEPGHG